ncbi:restriction endonuclease subunit S [Providencia rettgeri]
MTNFAFPPNWEKVELSDIAIFQNGYAFKSSTYSDAGDFVIRIGNVQDTGINLNNPAYVNATKLNAEKFRLSKDDILMSLTGNVGRTAIIKEEHLPAVLNQRVARVIFSSLMEGKFNFYLLRSSIVQSDLLKCAKGAAQLNISTKDIDKIIVGIPSIKEQKIIAEKLDTLLAQVDTTKARLEQIPQILKRFRQAVLAAIVNGKLSANTKQWKVYSLKNICVSISDGDHQAPPKSETGIPFLVISDVNKGKIDLENVSRWVPESYYLALKEIRKPSLNDILYTVTGSFGIPVVVNTTKPFCFQRHIAIIKPNSNLINYRFLSFSLESPQIFKHASDVATGTAQKTVSLSSLRNFELSVPSLKEQHEIARRVEQLFAYADTIEKQVNNALVRVNNLTQSILAKAFRGELTTQWRAENPDLISGENSAAALLEKIKAERAASGSKKVSRKKK